MRGKLLPALTVCGCTTLAGSRPAGWSASNLLWGAEEDVTIIAQPEEGARKDVVAEEKMWRLGLRLGIFAPSDSSAGYVSYAPGALVGAFYRGLQLAEKSIAWEAGAEFASAPANQGGQNANLVALRVSVLYGRWYSESATKFYLSGGASMLMEGEGEGEATGGAVNLGAGLGLNKWDARFGLSFLMGSKNATTVTTASIGYLF